MPRPQSPAALVKNLSLFETAAIPDWQSSVNYGVKPGMNGSSASIACFAPGTSEGKLLP